MAEDNEGDRLVQRDRLVAILPLGATEQHGPHLPLSTDWIIAEAMAERAANRAAVPTRVLPVERIGYSPEHLSWSETRSLSYAKAIERWIAIGARLAEGGIRRLVLLNAHGGNAPLMTIAATELRVRHQMLAVATSWTRHGDPSALVGEDEKLFGIHGGRIETAVMLALRPDLVRMEKARHWISLQQEHVHGRELLRAYGPHAHGWAMEDLNREGVVGDAGEATAELGQRLIDDAVSGLAPLIEEVAAFDPPWFGTALTERD